jgi:hypothetical protein
MMMLKYFQRPIVSALEARTENMDGREFISSIEKNLIPESPIIAHAIRKQLAELGTTEQDLTPDEAMRFIENMTDALDLFLGKAVAQEKRKFMLSLLRRSAPEYFKNRSLI